MHDRLRYYSLNIDGLVGEWSKRPMLLPKRLQLFSSRTSNQLRIHWLLWHLVIVPEIIGVMVRVVVWGRLRVALSNLPILVQCVWRLMLDIRQMNLRSYSEVSGMLDELRNWKCTNRTNVTRRCCIVSSLRRRFMNITQKLLLKLIQLILIDAPPFIYIFRVATLSRVWRRCPNFFFWNLFLPCLRVLRTGRLPIRINCRSMLTLWCFHILSSLRDQIISLLVNQVNIATSHLMLFAHITHLLSIYCQRRVRKTGRLPRHTVCLSIGQPLIQINSLMQTLPARWIAFSCSFTFFYCIGLMLFRLPSGALRVPLLLVRQLLLLLQHIHLSHFLLLLLQVLQM